MKTYVLMVSRYFPKGHSKEGKLTFFEKKIERIWNGSIRIEPKLHTIRVNYDLWAKRFEEINAGKARLSLRFWEGRTYYSGQVEFARLTKKDGIGLQKLEVDEVYGDDGTLSLIGIKVDGQLYPLQTLANNDGLTLTDFKEWFKGYDLSKPLAIIHFTNFRY